MEEEKQEISSKNLASKREESILAFWMENKIFEKSLAKPSPKGEFVFYEGPPTANGKPGIHHLEARAFKDLIPRYKTMRGFHVSRRGGWDTHGLPVELQVEKELGLNSKKEIESYGIDKFNQKCKESVWQYVDLWKRFTERIGYWLDLTTPYVTYDSSYIQAVWGIIKKVYEKNLLYKDYRVVPWCTRCGTVLSSHELAQGYKEVKDISAYIKFKLKDEENVHLLAWTTTPWTLPGNVALAVGEEIVYVKVKLEDKVYILAKERISVLGKDPVILEEFKGKDLIGREYEPIYPYFKESIVGGEKEKLINAFKIYDASFVTTSDGTGIVHIAPMYGNDDFELATKLGLPKFHIVKEDGTFIPSAGDIAGKFVKAESTTVDIIKDLYSKGVLFKKETINHTYPFCWRCETPLIYFGRDSWYIKMSSLRDKLIEENKDINWEPSYIKDGRFGEWLKEVKDWAISRERYWGTPLPIWRSEDGLDIEVMGSIEDIRKHIKPRNRYFVMRHGEGEHNVKYVVSSDKHTKYHLTEKGREQVTLVANTFKDKNIDIIFSSPLSRTVETAELMLEQTNCKAPIITDDRLREYEFGDFDGKSFEEYNRYFSSVKEQLDKRLPNGENIRDVAIRIGEFIYELDQKYEGKNILIVTHDAPASVFFALEEGGDDKVLINLWAGDFLPTGHIKEFSFIPLPHDESYMFDFHRPYVDQISFEKDGKIYKRIPEVMDVWFDSGSMPFASGDTNYPADFISEAIDQTRGWFYTLHAVGVLMERGKAYKNVICLGHILDKNGQKMSKSKGNAVDPWQMIEIYGADALRFWMYSVNQPGESKNFDLETVEGVVKKVFNLLTNVVSFYEMYAPQVPLISDSQFASNHIMDKWIISLLSKLKITVTGNLDSYKIFESSRALKDFIADLSQWYIRNSRDRFKSEDKNIKNEAIFTTRQVLLELAKIMAPFTPFLSEDIYRRIKGEKESVHLEDWGEEKPFDKDILSNMDEVRILASRGLELRMKSGIKVRQPLASFTFKSENKLSDEYKNIIKDELNVKSILEGDKDLLDTTISTELKAEGVMRELVRVLQDKRKNLNWNTNDKGVLKIFSDNEGIEIVKSFEKEIKKIAGLNNIIIEANKENLENSLSIDGKEFIYELIKA